MFNKNTFNINHIHILCGLINLILRYFFYLPFLSIKINAHIFFLEMKNIFLFSIGKNIITKK